MSAPAASVQAAGSESPPFLQQLGRLQEDYLGTLPGAGFPWLDTLRRSHLQAALDSGLPGQRSERWRYTALRALERVGRSPLAATTPSPALPPPLAPLRLVFVDGHFDAAASTLTGLPPGLELVPLSRGPQLALDVDLGGCDAADAEEQRWRRLLPARPSSDPADAFRNLNAALAGDGLLLRVAAGTVVEQPVELVLASAGGSPSGLWNLRNRVEIGAGAALTLVERHVDVGGSSHLAVVVGSIVLESGARLRHLRLVQAPTSQRIAHTEVSVGACARYLPLALESGAALSRHEWDVELAGAGSSLALRGLVFASGRQRVDTRLSVTHAVGATRSDTAWRSIAGGRGSCSFHGGITIAAGADGSDAALQTRSLLLSPGASVDAQPVLVIHADEVKASHGAAIGQLDANALFYLRTRGLDADAARNLLLRAFCAEMLALQALEPGAEGDAGPGAPGQRAAASLVPALEALLGDALQAMGADADGTP